jgi:hypothetical protein
MIINRFRRSRAPDRFSATLSRSSGIATLIINVVICSLCCLGYIVRSWASPEALILLGSGCCFLAFIQQAVMGSNLVLLYRLFLVGTFGMFAIPQMILAPNTALSPTMVEFQTLDNGAAVALLSGLAMGGSNIAWAIVMGRARPLGREVHFAIPAVSLQRVFLVLGTVFCVIHARVSAPVLLGSFDYGNTGGGEHFLNINTWGFAGLCCFLNLLILEFRQTAPRQRGRTLVLVWIGLVFFYAFVLRGFRSELVTFTVAATIFYWQFKNRGAVTPRLVFGLAGLVLALGVFTLVMGAIRGANDSSAVMELAVKSVDMSSRSLDETTGVDVSALNWLPNIGAAPLVLCMVGLKADDAYDFMWGETLWYRLINTLPRSVNPFRTDDLAVIYSNRFGVNSTGGMPELAEGYLNFGVAGPILVTAILSGIMFLFYRRGLERDDFKSWAVFGAILMSMVYSNLYGIGHVYKATLTGVLLNLFVFAVHDIFIAGGQGRIMRRA